ncbi:MAG TPA: hypothetical protein VJL54_09695 [Nitrososphaera sp.]|nr:hypothetical protein [Nitrososphaera sp.]
MGQKKVACKSCSKMFLAPPVDTGRQEISTELDESASFALICPFCMSHNVYTARDLQ